MPKTRHEPRRTCVACREEGTKDELVRLVRGPRGVEVDGSGRAPGRGAYLHRRAECLELARKRGGLARALGAPVPDSAWAALEG
ncbi:MAG TPA: YlxR family protein [Candidatus Dormibacteraeota bacterium]